MSEAPEWRSVYPVFVFTRRRDLETSARLLAGMLSLNTFGRRRLSHRQRLELSEIIDGLTKDARADRLPDIKVGWPDICPPKNGADVTDSLVMAAWNARAFTVFVRVDRDGAPTFTRMTG